MLGLEQARTDAPPPGLANWNSKQTMGLRCGAELGWAGIVVSKDYILVNNDYNNRNNNKGAAAAAARQAITTTTTTYCSTNLFARPLSLSLYGKSCGKARKSCQGLLGLFDLIVDFIGQAVLWCLLSLLLFLGLSWSLSCCLCCFNDI